MFLNNRYHDPTLGTFISVDPLVGATGEAYIYGSGNPTTLADPTGLCSVAHHDGETCAGAMRRTGGGGASGPPGTGSGGPPPGVPRELEVVSRPAPQLPVGRESAACSGPAPEANVNCFIDGVNGNGGAEAPFEEFANLNPGLLGECVGAISTCIHAILERAAELYAEYDLAKRELLNDNGGFNTYAMLNRDKPVGGATSCADGQFGLTLCEGGLTHLRAGTTIGEFYFVDDLTQRTGAERQWHESVHAWQTAAAADLGISPEAYLLIYFAAGTNGRENLFEQQADLCWGGYGC